MVGIVQAVAVTNLVRGETTFAQSFVQTAQQSAGPNFELQFFNTQNAVLDQLNDAVTEIQEGINTNGATALLNVQISRLEDQGKLITAFKNTVDQKSSKIEAALEYITALEGLATSGDSAAYDVQAALLYDTLKKAPSPTYETFGSNDRFRATKTDAMATLDSFNTNGFATQQDIDDTLAMLSGIKQDLNVSKALVDINADIAFGMQTSNQGRILELRSNIFEIETEAQSAATSAITEKQEFYSQILTMISLSFDASQEFTNFISQSVNFEAEPPAGSVLNLFS